MVEWLRRRSKNQTMPILAKRNQTPSSEPQSQVMRHGGSPKWFSR